MKKIFTLTQIFLLSFAVTTLFTACRGGDDDPGFPAIRILPGRGAERIYISGIGDDATLQLTKEQNYTAALFQFGSVIGWDHSNSPTAQFNPTDDASLSNWNDNWRSDAVHSVANLRAGKGDPCRLLGYKASQVRAMLAGDVLPDNGRWRLPTEGENYALVRDHERQYGWAAVGEFNGHYFPWQRSTTNWLPAAGGRSAINGEFLEGGRRGSYWSSTQYKKPDTAEIPGNRPYSLIFISSFANTGSFAEDGDGFAVRCVRI